MNDPRVEAAAKALEDWEFESFGNDHQEYFELAAHRALAAADAVTYEQIGECDIEEGLIWLGRRAVYDGHRLLDIEPVYRQVPRAEESS